MSKSDQRWVLAFDASCGRCRRISQSVAGASDRRLEVMPLTHPDVREWRQRSLGDRASWTPTLLRVEGTDVTAWTGAAMGIQVMRFLGPRSTMRVLNALGQRRRSGKRSRGGIRLLQVGAGLAVASSLILSKTPGAGTPGEDPHTWVETNKDRLPQGYDEVIAHAIPYRKAIVGALPQEARGQLWTEHVNRYRAAHQETTPKQTDVLDRAVALATGSVVSVEGHREALRQLEASAVEAFGHDEARALLATLGPDSESTTKGDPGCNCANYSNYCGGTLACTNWPQPCVESTMGCGTFWAWPCDGYCQPLP